MKNKKGFTLIELLVTIVIMISVLGLAIVSVNKISESRKKAAYESVKDTIITAAKEYFNNNEYIYNSLEDDTEMVISVGKLVEEDYLNVVTNPIDGKRISNCATVNVIKENGKLVYNYTESSEKCVNDVGEITIVTPGAPEFDATKECASPGNGIWCKSEVKVKLTIYPQNNYSYKVIKYVKKSGECIINDDFSIIKEISSSEINENSFKDEFNAEQNVENICYRVEDAFDSSLASVTTVSFGIDWTPPSLTLKGYVGANSTINEIENSNVDSTINSLTERTDENNWINKANAIVLRSFAKDGVSDINGGSCTDPRGYGNFGWNSWRRVMNSSEGNFTFNCRVEDNAGNESTAKYVVKRDATDPTLTLKGYVGANSTIGGIGNSNVDTIISSLTERTDENNWINKDNAIVLRSRSSDEVSGIKEGSCTDPRGNRDFESNSWRRVMDNSEGEFEFECEVVDNAGNESTAKYVVKRDVTLPEPSTITLQKCDYNSSTKKYSNCETYTPGTWTNKRVRVQIIATDDLSGVESTCYATSGDTTNYKCEDTKEGTNTLHPSIHAEGVSYIRFAIKDEAGNWYKKDTGSTLYTIKIDRTPPVIVRFENTKNTNCKTTNGYDCFYSHNLYLKDVPPSGKSIDVSGLSGSYKYNHCYDNAEVDGADGLICRDGFTSTGSKKNEVLYTGGYADRSYNGSMAVQHYTYQYYTSDKYYNLFYKIFDEAGNYKCYRYKLHYSDTNKYTTALPTYIASENNCK